jgi:hypothetical protein
MRYVGDGSFVVGIPTRELTEEEVNRFGYRRLLATGLYKVISKPKSKKTADLIIQEEDNGRD